MEISMTKAMGFSVQEKRNSYRENYAKRNKRIIDSHLILFYCWYMKSNDIREPFNISTSNSNIIWHSWFSRIQQQVWRYSTHGILIWNEKHKIVFSIESHDYFFSDCWHLCPHNTRNGKCREKKNISKGTLQCLICQIF